MRNIIKRLIKTKNGITLSIMILSSLVLGLSYGAFVFVTDGYKASELMIGNLMYGIDITSTGGEETINGTKVTLSSNKISTVLVKITSLNPVDSKYSLDYKITSGTGKIYYAESTGWLPSGKINKNNNGIYEKTVKVVIESTNNINVNFTVSGGYIHNSEVTSLTGYTKITNVYNNTFSYTTGKTITDVIDEIYGGESTTNYLQYPIDSDKTKNLWRIIGNYSTVGGIKIIKEDYLELSTKDNISSVLDTFYNTLTKTDDYVLNTSLFYCNGINTNCVTSGKNNIGLLSSGEYLTSSYMTKSNSWYLEDNNGISIVTNDDITTSSQSAYIRPVIYLQDDVNIIGSGTKTNPYTLTEKGDIKIASATLNGTQLDYFPSSSSPYLVNKVTCTNGSVGMWDNDRNSIRLTTVNLPTECSVDFKDGYTVTMNVTNGTSSPSSTMVGRNGKTSFTINPNTGYTLTGSSVTCDGGASTSISNNKINIANIKKNQTCKVSLIQGTDSSKTLLAKILEDNPTVKTRTNFEEEVVASNGTIFKQISTSSSQMTEDVNNDGIGETVYYYAGEITNNYVKFAGFYWRIIRSNEDGSIRLIFDDPSIVNYQLTGVSLDSPQNYPSYLPLTYMFYPNISIDTLRMNEVDSDIKTLLDDWYSVNLFTNYDKYISKTVIYCVERSNPDGNFGETPTTFGGFNRNENYTPSFRCGGDGTGGLFESVQALEDKFSASTSNGGNGVLTYPIALITADEATYSGLTAYTEYKSYLNNNDNTGVCPKYWTITPKGVFMDSNGTTYYTYAISYTLNDDYMPGVSKDYTDTACLKPVISLKSCVEWKSGDGTYSNPYTVSVSSTCENKEN